MESNIFILSQPIRSGKSTHLLRWIKTQKDIGGVLTPDIDGKRMLYAISTEQFFPLEVPADASDQIQIGRFYFSSTTFEKANELLLKEARENHDLLIIDEVGKLEMENKSGFEPAVSEVISRYRNQPGTSKLLLVIRDTLLNAAIEHYELQTAEILNLDFFKE
jgi:nucleoside-triphosphatase THEP1